MAESLYLGFDLSTQQLKAIVVRSTLKLEYEAKVDFDSVLPKYGIHKGVLTNPDEGEIFAPVVMWLEALDLVLQKLKDKGLDFSLIRCISGAGMQHGVVFWSNDHQKVFDNLSPARSLHQQMQSNNGDGVFGAFSHPFSPNWQDSSTQKQCEKFDELLGSPRILAEVTGSKAHHRFSGPQIMKFRENHPNKYSSTSRISLVSSFLASILLGKVAPIDKGDVCGMNLWDIRRAKWNTRLLELTAGKHGVEDLRQKLGSILEDCGSNLGTISKYFVSRYGFSESCSIIPFTGDNPATILSLPLQSNDAIVSLGTSTTFLMSTANYIPDPSYHFMNHPTTSGLYMFMLCYKNGGLAREQIRDGIDPNGSTEDWSRFNQIAESTAPLNQRNPGDPMYLGLYFPRPEIVPNLRAGTWRYLYEPCSEKLTSMESPKEVQDEDVRAILESQFLSIRLRSKSLVSIPASSNLPPQPRRIYLVGGGSQNPAIVKLCASVLGSSEGIYRLNIGSNGCALGAAYKAVWSCERANGETFEDFASKRWQEEGFVTKIAKGYENPLFEKYAEALSGFEKMEKDVVRLAEAEAEAGS